MDLNQIRSFLAVTQTLNFTSAAKQNGVPQSTISRQINDLERQLGCRLFYRTKRDVQITEEGRAFLPYAREILEAAKKGSYAVKQLHDGAKGRLSIARVSTSGSFLAKCLHSFTQSYPDIVVDITNISSISSMLEEGQDPYDFYFLHSDMLPDGDYYDCLDTHTDSLGLVLPKGHALASGELDLTSLQKEKFILLSEEENPILYMQVMDFFQAHRFSPNISNKSGNAESVLLSVSAGLGVTILPMSLPRELWSNDVDIVALPDMDSVVTYAIAWQKALLNPAAALFLEEVKKQIIY